MQLKKDKIVSIEYIGEEETADIEIIDAEGEHQRNYFANGFNVHNSGAMNNYPAYKFGKAKAEHFEHPIIEKWTKDTYGLIIYQEQVMQIVRELGDFDWAQTNTVRKVMSKSGGAEYFMKTFWPTWRDSCKKKGMEEKLALKAFHRIMSFGCVSGDTLIMNPYPNQNAQRWVKIEDLYKWNGYASPLAKGSKAQAYVKMNSYSFTKGRLKPNRIAKVFYNGKKELFKLVTNTGREIKVTGEHRFVCKRIMDNSVGYIKLKDMIENKTKIAIDGGYSKESFNMDFVKDIPDRKYGSVEIELFRNSMLNKPCDVCQLEFNNEDMEVHHITYDNPNSRMLWVCNECHKILEYRKNGRTKKDTKGHKISWEMVVLIKSIGIEDVYDLEMEDKSRPTYVANGFVSHNSWAFNLSHGVSYALVSYISMWFKVHYPLEFVTAYLNYVNDTGGEKIKDMIREAHRMGIEIREPDINLSGVKFVISDKAIVAGLSDIKHVGEKAVEAIVAAQPFTDVIDFIKRVNSRSCNKRTVEHLVMGGAFDSFHYNKKKLLEHLEEINQLVKKSSEGKLSQAKAILDTCMGIEELTEQEEAQMKSDVSPIQVGKHISEYYHDIIDKFGEHIKIVKLKDIIIDEAEQQKGYTRVRKEIVYVYGLVTQIDLKRLSQEVKEIIDKEKEQRYALTNLEDETDFCVTSFRGKIYERYEQKLFSYKNKVVLIKGNVNVGFKKIYVEELWELDELRTHLNNGLKPYNFRLNYLFQHPLHTYFNKLGGIGVIRKKFKCMALKDVLDDPESRSVWTIVIVKNILPFKIKNPESKYYGKKFYRVHVEDETYSGSVMIYPGDKDFKQKMYDLIAAYKSHEAIMLYIQKDLKYESNMYSAMTISMDKRVEWSKLYMRKFPFKKG